MKTGNMKTKQSTKLPKSWGVTLAIIMMGAVAFTTYSINLTYSYTIRDSLSGYNGWTIGVGASGGGSSTDTDEGDKACEVDKKVSSVSVKNGDEITYTIEITCEKDRNALIINDTMGSSSRGYLAGAQGGQIKYVRETMKISGLSSNNVRGDINKSSGITLKNLEEDEKVTITYKAIVNDESVDPDKTSIVTNKVKLSSGNNAEASVTIRGKNVTIDDEDSGFNECSYSATLRFRDISRTHWAVCFISQLVDLGVISGYEDGTFKPERSITRAELTKIALLINGYVPSATEKTTTSKFPDVLPEKWYNGYINKATTLGIVDGYEDGTFRPEANVTRAEAVKILLRSAGLGTESVDVVLYPDVTKEDWYYSYVAYATLNDIVDGFVDGRFGPNMSITRAEAAKIAANTKNVSKL